MTSLEELAKAAAKATTMTSEEMFEAIVTRMGRIETDLQMMIDSIVNIQDKWPMPKDGWCQFVEDVQRTNEKYGFNLKIGIDDGPQP